MNALDLSSLRIRIVMVLSLGAALAADAWAQQYTISTVAGNGTASFSGDAGAAAASATLLGRRRRCD